jgi:1-aminocyclopropane-1-carboxylate deaminase
MNEPVNLYSTESSILQRIENQELNKREISLYLKRDDLIDGEVSGNKWRKLKYNLAMAISLKNEGVLTFGGAFSNHLLATASLCKRAGLKSVGVVRGEELTADSNDLLKRCSNLGMEFKFISREEYRMKDDKGYKEYLSEEFENCYIIPEGGANFYGMIGCQEIVKEIPLDIDHIYLAQGTTTTSCGILMGSNETTKLKVVPVLKGFNALTEMANLLNYSLFDEDLTKELLAKVTVLDEYHFGGYAKYTDDLIDFIRRFNTEFQVKLDPIYTGKAMYALFDDVKKGLLDKQTIVFIHTGGIHGAKAFENRTKIKLY